MKQVIDMDGPPIQHPGEGAGGYGRTIADLAEQMETYDESLFLDDNSDLAIGAIAEIEIFIDTNTVFYPAIGNNEFRCDTVEELAAIDESCSVK